MKAKAAVRQRYSPKWIWRNQLQPLLGIDTEIQSPENEKKKFILNKLCHHKINSVQIDPFSYCNSRCWFCPVCYIPNPKHAVKQMPIELFRKIIVNTTT